MRSVYRQRRLDWEHGVWGIIPVARVDVYGIFGQREPGRRLRDRVRCVFDGVRKLPVCHCSWRSTWSPWNSSCPGYGIVEQTFESRILLTVVGLSPWLLLCYSFKLQKNNRRIIYAIYCRILMGYYNTFFLFYLLLSVVVSLYGSCCCTMHCNCIYYSGCVK